MNDISLFYTTTPDIQVAEKIIQILLDKKLIACANVFPAGISYYVWKNQTQKSPEVYLLLKSKKTLFSEILEVLSANHPYENPCLLELPVAQIAKPYLNWMLQELKVIEPDLN